MSQFVAGHHQSKEGVTYIRDNDLPRPCVHYFRPLTQLQTSVWLDQSHATSTKRKSCEAIFNVVAFTEKINK